jgi:dTDP-glucose pyrophosphorylase
MVIIVLMRKVTEDSSVAIYEFGPNEERTGRIQVDKATGKVVVLAEVPDDKKSAYSLCAVRKLTKHCQRGEFPERTCWAS